MFAKVDWFSFTVPANVSGVGHSDEAYSYLQSALERNSCQPLLQVIGGIEGTPRNGRGHYGAGVYYERQHISVWWGGIANHILVEIAGVGCDALREAEQLDPLIAAQGSRCTRLDIACDFETDVFPAKFLKDGYNERFKSRTSVTSSDGETEYVGSPKSERFTRVYRYREPHPRSNLLRVEFVLRSKYAKAACDVLVSADLSTLVSQLGGSYGFKSAVWKDAVIEGGKLRTGRDEAGDAGSLFWLERQVKPALRRMARDGLIDLEAWIATVLED